MQYYAIVEKTSLNVIDTIDETKFDYYPLNLYYHVIIDNYTLSRDCGGVLSARISENDNVEIYIDETKYGISSGMKDIREKRDLILLQTDWMMGTDSPLNDQIKEEIKIYRQKLRDITNSGVHPYDIVIPRHPMVKFPWEHGVYRV